MKKKDSKALAVITKPPHIEPVTEKKKVNGAIIPKPTKSEIVEALVLKKHRIWLEECKAIAEKAAELKKAFEDIVKSELKAKPEAIFNDMTIGYSNYDKAVKIEIRIPFIKASGVIQQAVKDLNKHDELRSNKRHGFDHAAVRAEMRHALTCDPARVNALAKSKEIEETLKHIEASSPKPMVTLQC